MTDFIPRNVTPGSSGYGFREYSSLATLDISGWDTSKVADFSNAFRNQPMPCERLPQRLPPFLSALTGA